MTGVDLRTGEVGMEGLELFRSEVPESSIFDWFIGYSKEVERWQCALCRRKFHASDSIRYDLKRHYESHKRRLGKHYRYWEPK